MSSNPSMKPLLIKFDLGLLKRIELEVSATTKESGKDARRTEVIRDLITESLDARCTRRNEGIPYVVAVSDEEMNEGEVIPSVVTKDGDVYTIELEPELKPGTPPMTPWPPRPLPAEPPLDRGPMARVVRRFEDAADVFCATSAHLGAFDSEKEGKTAGEALEGVRVEGDAGAVRSGGTSELAAVGVPEVGAAGGRGWLGGSVRTIGLGIS